MNEDLQHKEHQASIYMVTPWRRREFKVGLINSYYRTNCIRQITFLILQILPPGQINLHLTTDYKLSILTSIESVTETPILAFVGTYHDYRNCLTKRWCRKNKHCDLTCRRPRQEREENAWLNYRTYKWIWYTKDKEFPITDLLDQEQSERCLLDHFHRDRLQCPSYGAGRGTQLAISGDQEEKFTPTPPRAYVRSCVTSCVTSDASTSAACLTTSPWMNSASIWNAFRLRLSPSLSKFTHSIVEPLFLGGSHGTNKH